MGRLNQPK